MTKTPRPEYFVTSAGLAAALASPNILATMKGVLIGKAHPMTVRSLHKRGYIEKDQRQGGRADHNTIILSGTVERVREVLVGPTLPPAVAQDTGKKPRTPVTYSLTSAPEPEFSPTVEKVRRVMRSIAAEADFFTIASHPDLAGMNPGTLRNAIQQLRQAGVCQSHREEIAA